MSVRSSALLLSCALLLSACSSPSPGAPPESDAAPQPSTAPAEEARWSDWVELDAAASPLAVRGDRVVLRDHDSQELSVHDASGDEVFALPTVRMIDGAEPALRSDGENLYLQLDESGLPVVAVSWEDGSEIWRFEPAAVDPCAPPETFQMRLGNEAGGGRANDVLLLTADFATDESLYPADCWAHSNADMPRVPVALGIDTATGQQAWEPVTDLIGTSLTAVNGVTNDYVYQLIRSSYRPTLQRIDVATGAVDAVEFGGLDAAYDPATFQDPVYLSDMGGDMFYVQSQSAEAEFLTVDSWSDGAELIAQPLPHDIPCEAYVRGSAVGFAYCVQSPDMSFDGQYWVGAIASPDGDDLTGGSAESGQRRELWTAPGPVGLDEEWGYELDGYLGHDPIAPGADGAGVIALPGADAALTVHSLDSGEELWSYTGADGVSSTTYVPGLDEFVMLTTDRLVALDAVTGEEVWSEDAADAALFAVPGAITLTSNAAGTTRLRLAVA